MRRRDERIASVVITRNRLPELLRTLGHLYALPERPDVVVVDNASTDGTVNAVRRRCPELEAMALTENLGAAGRNVGVEAAEMPYVAFFDDDSWWAPDSLSRAANILDSHPKFGLLAERILVGPQEMENSVCAKMASSLLAGDPSLPGLPVLAAFWPARPSCAIRRICRSAASSPGP